ncbi:MAG: DUF3108 domain-containing protein [bacterium]
MILSGTITAPTLASNDIGAAPTIVLEYELHWRFFHILTFTSSSRMPESGGYAMETEAHTVGIIDTFFPWKARSDARGEVRDGKLLPDHYRTWSQFRDALQEVDIAYGPDGPVVDIQGKILEDGNRDPVPTALQKATLDPLSAVAELSRGLVTRGSCSGRWPIFDGLRRYDLLAQDLGPVEVPSSDNDPWSGPGSLCEVRLDLRGGQWRGEERPEEDPSRVLVWFLRALPEEAPIPVRFRIEADRGSLDVHLAKPPTLVREAMPAS